MDICPSTPSDPQNDDVDSLNLLLDTAKAERSAQLAHFDALDAKAGVVLGFAGALIALSPGITFGFRTPAVIGLVGSALLAAAAFLPRNLPALEMSQLRNYLRAEAEFTKLTLFDTILQMISEAADALGHKALLLKLSTLLLAVSAAILATGVVLGGSHG